MSAVSGGPAWGGDVGVTMETQCPVADRDPGLEQRSGLGMDAALDDEPGPGLGQPAVHRGHRHHHQRRSHFAGDVELTEAAQRATNSPITGARRLPVGAPSTAQLSTIT